MSARAARHGVVALAALDLRRRPDHRSELRSQLLLGETVTIHARRDGGRWCRIEHDGDGYRGWVRAWGLVEVPARRVRAWRERARGRVVATSAPVTSRPGGGHLVTPLFWQSRLIAGPRRGRHRRVETPDGRRGWVRATAVAPGRARPPSLLARVRSLLGVPYLWGGRTPAGLDCSGFIQLLLAEQGVALPRDAAEQERVGRPLADDETPAVGDLLFFARRGRPAGHVGVALGGSYYAHARGRVAIASLESNNPLCDKELLRQYRGSRRPRRGPMLGPTRPYIPA